MTETASTHAAASTHSRSAVGRLTVLVDVEDGTEKVTYERRFHDAVLARRWCEDKVVHAPNGTVVVEIQVTEEVWGRGHDWEAIGSRNIPETLQLGLRTRGGTVAWGDPHQVGTVPPARLGS